MKPKRYILFKDGQAFDLFGDQIISSFNIVDEEKAESEYGMEKAFIEIYYHDERGSFCEYDGKGSRTMDWWYLDDIAKQTDTVEELCDEYVLIDEENERYIKQGSDIHHIRRKMAIGNYRCFGAIWAMGPKEEPILKSIAKMNAEGELCLL